MADDVSIESSWSSESDSDNKGYSKRFPREDDNGNPKNGNKGIHSAEQRGRTMDRTSRTRRKSGSQSNGRASSIDFIRKVPVSPFHRDNNDQKYDTLERQRLNHTLRARSKSSSTVAVQALFSNSSHNKGTSKTIKSQSKIKRNSSEPYLDTQIPANYVRNIARKFQGQDALEGDENDNVILVSMTETGDMSPRQGNEADNQISYIQVCAEPPMSISSIDSDTTADHDSPDHKQRSIIPADIETNNDKWTDYTKSADTNPLNSHQENVAPDICSTSSGGITPSHATPALASATVPTNGEEPVATAPTNQNGSQPVQLPTLQSSTFHNGKAASSNSEMSMSTSGNLTSDSSDSMDKPAGTSRPGYARGRHKSYLRDTMQFSFYTGEQSTSSIGHQSSSDDSVYLQPREAIPAASCLPSSPMVSDISTSGCSSGSENDHPRGRWSDGTYACPSNQSSYASSQSPKGTCQSARSHVHTNGCYGQRQRSVSPGHRQRTLSPNYDERRRCYAEPVESTSNQPLSRSMPTLPAMPLTHHLSDVESTCVMQPVESANHHSKDPKVILRAAHLSNELVRLNQLLERLRPQELKQLLVQRLRQRDSKAIVALGIILPRTSFPSLDHVHCVRCHKNYDIHQNSACTLKHPSAYVMKVGQDNRGSCFYCKACDGQFFLQGLYTYDEKINSYMAGFCFNGQHSTNPADVNFSGIVKTCEENGCVECYV